MFGAARDWLATHNTNMQEERQLVDRKEKAMSHRHTQTSQATKIYKRFLSVIVFSIPGAAFAGAQPNMGRIRHPGPEQHIDYACGPL